MADRTQEVAVGRASEEVEIIPAALQRPSQCQGSAGTRIWSLTRSTHPGDPGKILGGGPHESPKWGIGSAPVLREQLLSVKTLEYSFPAGEAGLGLELLLARIL